MDNEKNGKKADKKKGFFAKIMDKLDKKLEEKAKGAGCCGNSDKNKGKPCC
ncbi:MAG: hypothetical protein HY810_01530 [Candidatus Omnitrophica bacterium]|nr:hypothetical protein [Candidatus Omnitrophota bacterium]